MFVATTYRKFHNCVKLHFRYDENGYEIKLDTNQVVRPSLIAKEGIPIAVEPIEVTHGSQQPCSSVAVPDANEILLATQAEKKKINF